VETCAKEVGVFLGDVRGEKGLFDLVLGFFWFMFIFLQCFIFTLFSPSRFFSISSIPITRDTQSCVHLLSFPPSMIDGVLDFPLIWGLWTFFFIRTSSELIYSLGICPVFGSFSFSFSS